MRTPTFLALILALGHMGCPSSEPVTVATVTDSVRQVPAPVVMDSAPPTVAVPLGEGEELPRLDSCGGLLDSNNRCGPVTSLSAAIPGDVCLPEGVQEPNSASVEHLAWRAFVGLTWPAKENGVADPAGPIAVARGVSGPDTIWETWRSPRDLVQVASQEDRQLTSSDWSIPSELPPECAGEPGAMLLEQFGKVSDAVHAILPPGAESVAGGGAFDQNGRPVLVETRMNRTMWDTIVSGGWSRPGASPRGIQFPNNHGDTKYGVGAMALQAAWVVVDSPEVGDSSLHVREAYVRQAASADRPAVCDKKSVQLVALQIAHKAGAGDDTWVWSVFESTSAMPLDVVEPDRDYIVGPSKCDEPDAEVCQGVIPGSASEAALCCPNTDLHGRIGSAAGLREDRAPTSLTRLDAWEDVSGCSEMYRTALGGSPWANFALVGAQWWGRLDAETYDFGPTPKTLRSLALEPFAVEDGEEGQDTTSSCIACHALGDDSIFFLSPLRLEVEVSATDASPSEPTSAPE